MSFRTYGARFVSGGVVHPVQSTNDGFRILCHCMAASKKKLKIIAKYPSSEINCKRYKGENHAQMAKT